MPTYGHSGGDSLLWALLVGRELTGPECPHVGEICLIILANNFLGYVCEAEFITKSSGKGH